MLRSTEVVIASDFWGGVSMRAPFNIILSTRRQQAKALDMLATKLRSARMPAELDQVLELGAALAAQALDVDFTEVSRLLPGGERLQFRAGIGWERELLDAARIEFIPGTQALRVLTSGVPLVIGNSPESARFEPWPLLREHGISCGVCVPILTKGQALGIVGAYSRRRKAFHWDDVDFLEMVADILGVALERVHASMAQPSEWPGLATTNQHPLGIVDLQPTAEG